MELFARAGLCVVMVFCFGLAAPHQAEAGDPPKKQPRQVTQGASPKTTPPKAPPSPQKTDKSRAVKTPTQQPTSSTKSSARSTKHPAPSTKHEAPSTQHPAPGTKKSLVRKTARGPAPAAIGKYHGTFVEGMKSTPFPLAGKDADPNFFDYVDPKTGERFRTTRTWERLSEKDHYRDNGVLFHVPTHFNPNKPFAYVVFFHGNRTEVRQALKDYRLDDQINRSAKNVILVLPPFARNAADSSPGKFAKKNAFRAFMQEVAMVLSPKLGKKQQKQLEQVPIILAAFSGGYKPLACILDRGGTDSRIRGILLLDGLYEDLYIFGKWLLYHSKTSFFINIYTEGSVCQDKTAVLAQFLREHRFPFRQEWPKGIGSGQIFLIRSSSDHMQVPVEGPPREPLAELLRSLKNL